MNAGIGIEQNYIAFGTEEVLVDTEMSIRQCCVAFGTGLYKLIHTDSTLAGAGQILEFDETSKLKPPYAYAIHLSRNLVPYRLKQEPRSFALSARQRNSRCWPSPSLYLR